MKVFISFSGNNPSASEIAQKVRALLEAVGVEPIDGYKQAGSFLNMKIKELITSSNMFLRIVVDDEQSRYLAEEHAFARNLELPVLTIADNKDTLRDSLYSEECVLLMDDMDEFKLAVDVVRFIETTRANGGYLFTSEPGDKNIERDRRDMLNALMASEFFKISQRKKNFCYDIVLEEHDDPEFKTNFYKAFFELKFEATLKCERVVVETAKTVDNFHKIYNHLIQDPSSVYRYILKTSDDLDLNKKTFSLKKVTVNDAPLIFQEGPTNTSSHFQYQCESHDVDLKRLVGHRVSIEIALETIVDKRRSEFTVMFGYPVKNINLSFIFRDTDIVDVDIVDVVTAKEKFKKSKLPGKRKTGVQAVLNGWAFPDSAIVYVWSRSSAVQARATDD